MATIRSTEATPRTVGAIGDYLIDNENRIYKCIAMNTYPTHDGATILEPETEYVWKFIGMDTSEATSVQADWNVTDSSDPAFIQNKPFGKEKGKVVRSVSGLSWSENTDTNSGVYPYKVDVTNTFEPFQSKKKFQLKVNGISYSDITVTEEMNNGFAYELTLYGEDCPVKIDSTNGIRVASKVIIYAKTTDITSVEVIDLDQNSIKAMSSDYIEFASSTSGSTKKFKITVDDSGAISATAVSS